MRSAPVFRAAFFLKKNGGEADIRRKLVCFLTRLYLSVYTYLSRNSGQFYDHASASLYGLAFLALLLAVARCYIA